MLSKLLPVAATLFLVSAIALTTVVEGAKVTTVPGLNQPLPSDLYAGYMNVGGNGRSIYYMFVESQRSPSKDPLVLWLTGGPGCSGLIGMFEEHGQFNMNFTANGNGVQLNPYAWSNVANVIYIESPVGVGFSYANNTKDYVTGDNQTAHDTYNFLQGFLAEFPQFAANDFYVAAESYGGHYGPEITYKILQENQNGPVSPNVNIKLVGMLAGNPWTDPEVEAWGVVDNWWQRAIISRKVHQDIKKYCDYKDITFWIINNVTAGAPVGGRFFDPARLVMYSKQRAELDGRNSSTTKKCFDALIEGSLKQFGSVNILGVYLDVCVNGTNGGIPDQPNYCSDGQLTTYLNLPEVQKAFHVDPALVPGGQWAECSNFVNHHYSTIDTQHSMLPRYEAIIAAGLKVLVYSGDNDAIVPYTGTRRWIEKLEDKGIISIVNDTHEWYCDTNGRQVGGWAVNYNNKMVFTTVRDAGHMVPFMQPKRALHMFREFLEKGQL